MKHIHIHLHRGARDESYLERLEKQLDDLEDKIEKLEDRGQTVPMWMHAERRKLQGAISVVKSK